MDCDSLSNMARKTGLKSNDLKTLFESFCKNQDSIWIDLTEHSPCPLRLNGYTKINKIEN